jgi:cobalt-zinc-cadmium efflux system outer membrane protein
MKPLLFCLLFLYVIDNSLSVVYGQSFDLQACEKAFQQNNLLLLSGQLGITKAEAQLVQSKIWPQPVLIGEINAYNPQANRAFDIGSSGQKAIAIQELIRLGGKRKNEIAFAQENKAYALLSFEQLLRSLKLQLHQAYYTLAVEELNQRKLTDQLGNIDSLLANYQKQVTKGNIASKDLIRLSSLQIELKNEFLSSSERLLKSQQNMRLLTGITDPINPTITVLDINSAIIKMILPPSDILIQQALGNNTEFLLYNEQIKLSNSALAVEQSHRIPDLTVGGSYDQRGGAFGNQVNLTFQLPLPLWNSNKGKIQEALAATKEAELTVEYERLNLETSVNTAIELFKNNQQQLQLINRYSSVNADDVYKGVLLNFKNGNISLLEFTDFMESYNHNIILVNNLTLQSMLCLENIYFLTNQNNL